MSDYASLLGMLSGEGAGKSGVGPVPPGPAPIPPFGGGIIVWIIILLFLFKGGFGVQGGCNNVNTNNTGCGNNLGGNCGCGYINPCCNTGYCSTLVPNPNDYIEYCNCCGKQIKDCQKQKYYIVDLCQCGGMAPAVVQANTGANNSGSGFGIWWILILIILFCFKGTAPIPAPPQHHKCECED